MAAPASVGSTPPTSLTVPSGSRSRQASTTSTPRPTTAIQRSTSGVGCHRDFEALLEQIRARDVGLMVMKAVARNLWREGDPRRSTWYEPLEDQRAIDAAVAFALSTPEVTGIATAGDVGMVPKMVAAEE